MAHLGTGMQLLCVGPQNAYLDMQPQVTAFYRRHKRCTRHATEPCESLPLQSVGFGGTAVFDVSTGGDMLGDMHVQIQVPAVQPTLGYLGPEQSLTPENLPEHTVDNWDDDMLTSVQLPHAFLTLDSFPLGLKATTVDGDSLFGFNSYTYAWMWYVLAYPSGLVHSYVYTTYGVNVSGIDAVPPKQLTITTARGVTTLDHRFDQTLAFFVGPGGEVVLENGTWHSPLAYMLMRRARFVVDDLVVHDHERLWYDLLDRLTVSEGHAAGLRGMLGTGLSMGRPHTLFLPLKFMCCATPTSRHKRSFFPRLLVPQSVVRVELDLEHLAACATPSVVPLQEPASLDARLVVEHVFLDANERASMLLRRRYLLMVEGVQDMEATNYDEGALQGDGRPAMARGATVDLSEINLPVRALVWVVYRDAWPYAQVFNYLDAVQEARLMFGSLERVAGDGPAFSKQQTWTHAPRCAAEGAVYMYSFALRPWEPDPSGAVDFSLVRKPTLRLLLGDDVRAMGLKCKVFAATYNWLRFENGRVMAEFTA